MDMRINYYRFPEGTSENILLENRCAVVLKTGEDIYVDSIPDDKRELVDHIDDTIGGISVTHVKQLIRKYGGYGWVAHIERDGSLFEITEISLTGNNSKFKYNHHL